MTYIFKYFLSVHEFQENNGILITNSVIIDRLKYMSTIIVSKTKPRVKIMSTKSIKRTDSS